MMDCIFIVDDCHKWHAKNLLSNPSHYSLLMRYCGAKTITKLQSFGGGILYNPYVNIEWNKYHPKLHNDLQLKYGVIATSQLVSDLLYWDSCYIAGRLHKPTLLIKDHKDTEEINTNCIQFSNDIMTNYKNVNDGSLSKKLKEIYEISIEKSVQNNPISRIDLNEAMLLNWDFAARIALLILVCDKKDGKNKLFTIDDVLHKIVSISYFGDDRMKFGEDKQKIEKIMTGSKDYLLKIYEPILDQYIHRIADGWCECRTSIDELVSRLPKNVVHGINKHDRSLFVVKDNKPRYDEWLAVALQDSISKIIKKSSRKQVLKSFVATDLNKIALYFMQKVYKQIVAGYE